MGWFRAIRTPISHTNATKDRGSASTKHRGRFMSLPGGVSVAMAIDQALSAGLFFSSFLRSMSFRFSRCASTSSSEAQP